MPRWWQPIAWRCLAAGAAPTHDTDILCAAIKTPYLPNGKFDLSAYDNLVDQQIKHGVEGLIIGGTTGEGHLMTWDEHIMLIAHTVNVFGRQIKVIGNTGSNSTREALHATEQVRARGRRAGALEAAAARPDPEHPAQRARSQPPEGLPGQRLQLMRQPASCRGACPALQPGRQAGRQPGSALPGPNPHPAPPPPAAQGFAVGMHASLQINPYYGKTSLTGLREHFRAVLGEGPAIIYNVPGRTGASDIVLLRRPGCLGWGLVLDENNR